MAQHPPRPPQSAASNQPTDPRNRTQFQRKNLEAISGKWLVKALLITLGLAAVALYCTVCLLFYQGQWQFVFFPSKGKPPSLSSIAASSGLPITDVRFDTTEEGVEQLDGWWIPGSSVSTTDNAQQNAVSSQMVVLFCHNGRTTLPENIAALRAFHALDISVFAFDYRGFGLSQSGHPSQQKAYADGVAAVNYLIHMRNIDPNRIVIYGAELGAAVAVHAAQQSAAQQSGQLAGVILEDPQSSFAKEVKREQHIHVLPLWLIFPDRFDISQAVTALRMPKLLLFTHQDADATQLYAKAPAPKQEVKIEANARTSLYAEAAWQQVVQGFLRSVATQSH